MSWRVVSGEVIVDGDRLLTIEDLRAMRRWVMGNPPRTEGAMHVNDAPNYSQCIDIVDHQYPGGIAGWLADENLV